MKLFYRLSPPALFAVSAGWLLWNAWFRESTYGDAVVGEAYVALYFWIAVTTAAVFVIVFPGYRPQDRYWAYATLGSVLGFWMQR